MEESFNVDLARAKRQKEIMDYLSQHQKGELELSKEMVEQLQAELKIHSDAEARKYSSDNDYSAKTEAAEIEAKSRKEPWYKWLLGLVLVPIGIEVIKGGVKLLGEKKKMDRYESQHKVDQDWDMNGTLSNVSKETERVYEPYKMK